MKAKVTLILFLLPIFLMAQRTIKLDQNKVFKTGAGLAIECKAGTEVQLTNSGKLLKCVPAKDFVIWTAKHYKYDVAADHLVEFDSLGNILKFTLKANAVFESNHGEHYAGLGGYEVELYSDGAVKSFVPKFEIETFAPGERSVMAKARERVEFFENGFVKSFVTPVKLAVFDKQRHKYYAAKDTRIEFYPDGTVKSFVTAEQITINGKTYNPGDKVEL